MLSTTAIKQIIETVYPDEYIIVGEEAIDTIIPLEEGEVSVYKPSGGSDFDISSTLTIISTSIIVIKNIIEIYQKLKPISKDKVDKAELAKELNRKLKSKQIQIKNISDKEYIQLIDETINMV